MTTRRPGERRRTSPEISERTLVKASQALTLRLDVAAACAALSDGIQELVGSTSSVILLKEGETGLLRRAYGRGVLAELASDEGPRAPDGADPVGVAGVEWDDLAQPVADRLHQGEAVQVDASEAARLLGRE